jgi:hypothetical protein
MQATVTVEGKTFGRGRALFPEWIMPVEVADEQVLTLGDLIARVVREEVQAFRERRAERRLVKALTERQIAEAAMAGKVTMGGRDEEPDADPKAAVATALQAFRDGIYYVFVDDIHIDELDEPVRLCTESRVTFLRLVALAGG